MLSFACYQESNTPPDLRGAYLIGIDGTPVRGAVRVEGNAIICEPRNQDAVALCLLWPVADYGPVQLETTRLPRRQQPYHLHVELARHRLMRISVKREEWGLYDYPEMAELSAQVDRVRDLFLAALQSGDDPVRAARLADEALALGLRVSDELCRFHAGLFVSRRQQGGLRRSLLGVALPPRGPATLLPRNMGEVFDFVRIPFVWRELQPQGPESRFDDLDRWVRTCRRAQLGLQGGPLLNFGIQFVPDWLYRWEKDYEAIFRYAREHIQRSVQRYAEQISTWVVASGLHGENVFPFNFEQMIELTRMAASVTKQLAPQAQVVLDLAQPWGEYFARNQRTAPPLLYAEMAVQSGIRFDAFGVQLVFGLDSEGFHLRDALQISSLLDRIATLGRPLHITALAVPSRNGPGIIADERWSESGQAAWLAELVEIALSRPFVESVCLQTLADGFGNGIPAGGVLNEDRTPKAAFRRLAELRRDLLNGGRP